MYILNVLSKLKFIFSFNLLNKDVYFKRIFKFYINKRFYFGLIVFRGERSYFCSLLLEVIFIFIRYEYGFIRKV